MSSKYNEHNGEPVPSIVTNATKPFAIDVKRFYIPGAMIKAACPLCGKDVVKHLDKDYLSYPVANHKMLVWMYHYEEGDDGDHECEFQVEVILRVILEASTD